MKKVTFYGGFHNSSAISARLTDTQYNTLKEGVTGLREILTESQQKRLDKHFCGIKGCMCGGISRTTIES